MVNAVLCCCQFFYWFILGALPFRALASGAVRECRPSILWLFCPPYFWCNEMGDVQHQIYCRRIWHLHFEHLPSVTSYFHFSVKKRTSPLWHLMIEFRMFYLMWTFRVQVDCVVNAWPLHSFVLPCCCDCGLLTVNAACLTVAVDPVAPA